MRLSALALAALVAAGSTARAPPHASPPALAPLPAASPPVAADPLAVAAAPHTTLGADGIGVLPVGDYGRAERLGIGVLGRLEIPAGPGFFPGRIGVIFHANNESDAQLTLIPIYPGFRMPIGTGGGYVAGELGITVAIG